MTIRAIYENGVFRPTEPVDIAERTPVEVILPGSDARERTNKAETAAGPVLGGASAGRAPTEAMGRIYGILSRSYETGQRDLAERHNEHQR